MILVEKVVGNRDDPAWRERLAASRIDTLALDQWEAQRNRIRKRTTGGEEIALALPRHSQLRDGDLIFFDEGTGRAIVATITLKEVMVVELGGTASLAPELIARTCFELGHALGNQHWPAVVKGARVYVPLTIDRKVMDSVMRTHRFEHLSHAFVPGAEVIPYLAPHEARRLFGGAEATPHGHAPSMPREGDPEPASLAHEHEHEHEHEHDEGAAHSHAHRHAHQHAPLSPGREDHVHVELHGNFARHRHDHEGS